MKVTIGGSKKITIGNQPYEPIQAESVFIIEKEMSEDIKGSEYEKIQDKINEYLEKDLEKKVEQTLKLQQKTRGKMKALITNL
jgi:hypothetical protein